MTTITYRDGWLASDSRSSSGSMLDYDKCRKLFPAGRGAWIGMSGNWGPGMQLLDAVRYNIRTEREPPKIKLKCMAILAFPDRKVYLYEGDPIWYELTEWKYPYFAIGSGAPYALAAMDTGADAITAIEVAKLRDLHTGGRIQKRQLW